ncbi:peptide chain release factor N(5)-glutamine methyltransferase [Pelagibacteraceae bacterium]|jgi:release factor glutamine methyltransferase|nr:peptide chain release factor N(5)-glutamine methyltransferase [Pelagibacteraceae bacterium]
MLVSELLISGSKRLKEKNIKSHLLDSELILSSLLNKKRENLLLSNDLKLPKDKIFNFNQLINRRLKNEPMAYILKKKSFWNSDFFVNNNTLIPRPETELLVEKIVDYYSNNKIFILDVGTGSGCILISILEELKNSKGIGIDLSKKAIEVAIINAKNSLACNRIKFIKKSISSNFYNKFDLIVSNPPYICNHEIISLPKDIKNFEPKIALDGGKDGLDVIEKVIYKAKDILKINGMLALEVGYGQYKKVSQILRKKRFREKFLIKDYQNNIRCILSVLDI